MLPHSLPLDACLWGLEEQPHERLLTETEIRQQLAEWKANAERQQVTFRDSEEDTQPLSQAEIAQKLFEGKCMAVLKDGKMAAGYFCDLIEVKAAIRQLSHTVGRSVTERVLSDFFVSNNHLFL